MPYSGWMDHQISELKKKNKALEAEVKQLTDLMAICDNDNMQFEKRNTELEAEVKRLTERCETCNEVTKKSCENCGVTARLTTENELLKSNLDIQNDFYNAALEKAGEAEARVAEARKLIFMMQYTASSYPENNFYKEAKDALTHYSSELEKALGVDASQSSIKNEVKG